MRTKKRELFLHNPSTKEILQCFLNEKKWARLLLNRDKDYNNFLQKLLNDGYYSNDERKTIKDIALRSGFKTEKATKWIAAIYDDIFELNAGETSLFETPGIRHHLSFKYFDNRAYLSIWLPQSPRAYDDFICHFVTAKTGTSRFWVREVTHQIENGEYSVHLRLDGCEKNIYREWLVDKALYTGLLNFMDIHTKEPYEIDKMLYEWYRR